MEYRVAQKPVLRSTISMGELDAGGVAHAFGNVYFLKIVIPDYQFFHPVHTQYWLPCWSLSPIRVCVRAHKGALLGGRSM